MNTSLTDDDIDVAKITREQWKRQDFKDAPPLPGGIRGPGWYWLFKAGRGSIDEWWFGPYGSASDARWEAEQDTRSKWK